MSPVGDDARSGAPVSRSLPDFTAGAQFLEVVDPPIRYSIRPIAPRSEVIEVNGGHGRLKSTLAVNMALSIATGRPWGPYEVAKGAVGFLSMEDREALIRRRVFCWLASVPEGKERQDAIGYVRSDFFALGRERARDFAMTRVIRGGRVEPVPEVIRYLTRFATGKVALFVETSARLHRGDEDNEGLAVFAMALEEVATDSGASIFVIRHQSKSDARMQSTDSYSGRGGGALSDACRSILVVTRPDSDDSPAIVTHAKNSYGPRASPTHWEPVPYTFKDGSDGMYLRLLDRSEVVSPLRDEILNTIDSARQITNRELMRMYRSRQKNAAALQVIKSLLDEGAILASINKGRGKKSTLYRMAESRQEGGDAVGDETSDPSTPQPDARKD